MGPSWNDESTWTFAIIIAVGVFSLAFWGWARFTDSPRVRHICDNPDLPYAMTLRNQTGAFFAAPLIGTAMMIVALSSAPGMPPIVSMTTILITAVVSCILCATFGYRRVLPLWLYPPWLRDRKREQRDEIRANRWWRRRGQS